MAKSAETSARPQGVFLPLITPFIDGEVDIATYRRMLLHYLDQGIHGVVPLGTTGESPTIEDDEYRRIVEATVEVANGRVPIFVGVSSNSTNKATHLVEALNRYAVDGYLVTSPYYNLPSQQGIAEHFTRVAAATDKKVLIYNIPYRTGRNVENETVLKLSRVRNIVGIKDSCGFVAQSIELLRERDPDFSVLTGEDILFYLNCASGGNGGILASAHVQTDRFIRVWSSLQDGDVKAALPDWNALSSVIPLLFREPNPAPIKYILARKGIIRSPELRQPLTTISDTLRTLIDQRIADGVL